MRRALQLSQEEERAREQEEAELFLEAMEQSRRTIADSSAPSTGTSRRRVWRSISRTRTRGVGEVRPTSTAPAPVWRQWAWRRWG